MGKKAILMALTAGTLMLSGCANQYQGQHQQEGMLIGGILGGVLGSQVGGGTGRTAATIVGTMMGAAIGGNVGAHMDEVDRLKTANTLETVRTGVSSEWRNPDTGVGYEVTPTRTYNTAQGPCREYTVKAEIGGRPETVYGTACRQPDGSWQMQQ